jgi:hypothetical protein
LEDAQREILHDHYKESFQYIRERERLRDRLFLFLIVLYTLLAVQIQYPRKFDGTVETINLIGIEVDVSSLPLPAFLSATWVFVLAITLRYCQTSITVERQYDYLHKLEEALSPEFGGELYRREGRAYDDQYPAFSSWAWRFYTVVLPMIAIGATGVLIYEEVEGLSYPLPNQLLDLGIALYVVVSFFLFRVLPLVRGLWNRLWALISRSGQGSAP